VRNEAEGVDIIAQTGWGTGIGEFQVSFTGHQYLTNQFQTTETSVVVDCKGKYGTSCDPVPKWRHVLRFSWYLDNLTASVNWRHIGSMDCQDVECDFLFDDFKSIKSYDYLDLTFGYTFRNRARFSLLVRNVMDEDPPIIGNETGSTSFNSGNTFPSLYDTMGRIWYLNLRLMF
jgi:outer membrane receptor protein involved in Fe transport